MSKFQTFANLIVNHLILWILILSLIAFSFPRYFSWLTDYTSIFLGIAMFGMGTTIRIEDLKEIVRHPKAIAIGVIAQFLIMPLVAWFLCMALRLPEDIRIGVILVGACPGGTASNVISHIAGADVALSVSMTTVSTLLAPFLTPLFVYFLAGTFVEVSLLSMFLTVVKVILIPVILGIIINRAFWKNMEKVRPTLPLVSSLAIILIIAGIIAQNSGMIVESGLMVTGVVFLHNLLGLTCGLVFSKICRLPYKQASAVAIEVGMQNSGLAISLAAANFSTTPLATLPGAIFSVVHNLTGTVFAYFRRKKSQRD